MNRSFKIGLTGGIASGKSIVANLFSDLGVEILDADEIAHSITSKHGSAYDKIIKHFGKSVLADDNELDRKKLRTIIFNNSELRKDLEQIIHPEVHSIINKKTFESQEPYQIIVIPLLIETGYQNFVDRVLIIDCSLETQLVRLMNRDDEKLESARKIVANQIERKERLKFADDIIENKKKTSISVLKKKVLELHETYLELSENSLI
jgi:dephospho-CoA kinase